MAKWFSDPRINLSKVDEAARGRFIARLAMGTPEECWIWDGGLTIQWNGRSHPVYRVSYRIFHCVDPGAQVVRHSCDNRKCVNPYHLSLGSQRDNFIDSVVRDRCQQQVVRSTTASLSVALAIIKAFEEGQLPDQIAASFGKSRKYVQGICAGRKWKTAREARERMKRA